MKINLAERLGLSAWFKSKYDGGNFLIFGGTETNSPDDTPGGVTINTLIGVTYAVLPNGNIGLATVVNDPSNEGTGIPTFARAIAPGSGGERRQFTAKMSANTAITAEVVVNDPADAAATQLFQNRALNLNSLTITWHAGY